ncbi:hypothetical protein RR48_01033 [Papilio machaon]|uniref:Uncharacterized protein n=1 Tax=Papilio machaon TaxID=76193 RepID=A0A0N1IQ20_PAPMA|nr:hypothetical protein RR48_12003 [Papilio machaon]KPJ18391.1 hypothetical protein RR48_01033 [Papilio machaon]
MLDVVWRSERRPRSRACRPTALTLTVRLAMDKAALPPLARAIDSGRGSQRGSTENRKRREQ